MKGKIKFKKILLSLFMLFLVLILILGLIFNIDRVRTIDGIFGEETDYILEIQVNSGGGTGFDGKPLPSYRTLYRYYVKDGDILHLDKAGQDYFYNYNIPVKTEVDIESKSINTDLIFTVFISKLEIISLSDSGVEYIFNGGDNGISHKKLSLNEESTERSLNKSIRDAGNSQSYKLKFIKNIK